MIRKSWRMLYVGSLIRKNVACTLLCLLLALGKLYITEAGFTMKETCNYISKGYIGDPSNCQNWGYCRDRALVATGSCKEGFLFDSRASMCNYANRTTCRTTMENACEASTEPAYLGDPNNCQSYGYCAKGALIGSRMCPDGQVFDPRIVECTWAKNYNCPANSVCRLVANNVFAGDPDVCGNWIRCVDGSGVSSPCPNQGQKFDPIKGACVSNYDCGVSEGTPSSPQIPSNNMEICKAKYSKSGTQYFSDGATCYGYYACTSADSKGIWGSCPWATHFDEDSQTCGTPYTVKCKHDRCGNMNEQFVAQLGCKSYGVCQNSVNTSNGTCAESNSKFPYFDEYGGGCVANIPKQAICEST